MSIDDEVPHNPPPDVDEENAFATPERIPSYTLQPQSVMPTPGYDPRFNFPYFDSTQAPPQMSDANVPQLMLVTSRGDHQ